MLLFPTLTFLFVCLLYTVVVVLLLYTKWLIIYRKKKEEEGELYMLQRLFCQGEDKNFFSVQE